MATFLSTAPIKRAPAVSAYRGSFTESLGILGWKKLEPVLLAALATELPLLLVGGHGTGKSLIVERTAAALGLAFRHYNASLLNYDDLVGIPLPDERGTGLQFRYTPGAIWDAEFAFFDEISRCRPDLQNKLFPIVHERRVAGIALERLRFRWAAMNPPAPLDAEASGTAYLGSEALDLALADRFVFVVRAPDWRDLSKTDRLALVSGFRADASGVDLPDLVAQCATRCARIEEDDGPRIATYIVALVDLLAAQDLRLSPRRARVLAQAVAAVHAARIVTGVISQQTLVRNVRSADLATSAEIALLNGLPQQAEEVPPSRAMLHAAHTQAWAVSGLDDRDPMKAVLEEPDLLKRVTLGDRLGLVDRDLSQLVTQALAGQPSDARRVAVGTALFLAYRERRDLTPAAWEPLGQLARRVIEPRAGGARVPTGPELERWREINAFIADGEAHGTLGLLERNYLLAGFPDLWRATDWRGALKAFRTDMASFEPAPRPTLLATESES